MISCILFRESEENAGLKSGLTAVMLGVSFISAASVVPLFIISKFFIHAFCLFCVLTWIVNIIIFIMMILMIKAGGGKFLSSIKSDLKSAFSLLPGIYKNLKIIIFAFYMIILFSFLFTLDRYLVLNKAATTAESMIEKENEFIRNYYNSPVSQIDLKDTPVFAGNIAAKITVLEYMNFDCPACRKAYAEIKPVIEKYSDRVKLFLGNFPLDGECNPGVAKKKGGLSCTASLVSIGLHNESGYKNYVDTIMRERDRLNPKSIFNAVGSAGISFLKADSYIKSAQIRGKLIEEVNQASKLGINGTPTFILNGRLLPSGAINPALFEKLLRMEIKRVYGE
jgi:protein-disulfide isomerase